MFCREMCVACEHQVHTVHAGKNGTPKSLDKLKSKLAKMSTETTLYREQVPEKSRYAFLILLDNNYT